MSKLLERVIALRDFLDIERQLSRAHEGLMSASAFDPHLATAEELVTALKSLASTEPHPRIPCPRPAKIEQVNIMPGFEPHPDDPHRKRLRVEPVVAHPRNSDLDYIE